MAWTSLPIRLWATPYWTASFTTLTASSSKATVCAGEPAKRKNRDYPARDRPAGLDEETISSTDTIVSRVRRHVNAQHLLSVITITGIRDHHRLERLITIPGMRDHRFDSGFLDYAGHAGFVPRRCGLRAPDCGKPSFRRPSA